MINQAEIDELLLNEYAKMQRIGFRVKLVCIRCGAKFDVDDITLALQHKQMCDITN